MPELQPSAAQEEQSGSPVRIALVGDLHGAWSTQDTNYFNTSSYDLILLTGDLGSGTALNGLTIAKMVARLNKPTLVIAGNNDAPFATDIAAEFKYQAGLAQLMRLTRAPAGEASSQTAALCGYDLRSYEIHGTKFTILVGRPYAMGGDELSFPDLLQQRYGVDSIAQSALRLRSLVDAAPGGSVIWLAHNGPTGLGSKRSSIWGCDFRPQAGDWGDRDLAEAIRYTQKTHVVRAVIAGHMHRGGEHPHHGTFHRESQVRVDNTLYVNPAVTPRIVQTEDGTARHHMALELHRDGRTEAHDVWIP
jgi:uncharacterized protein (TIGR04168 family)